ncbi:zincin-like metallopeptidase domain-containing protein [Mucilaginibacter boryungensis]|uniref:Polyvalent protein metallopeptidase domain-containing protein n=1 Tax=Mucilaginibacter boryungensis TaxID=768480 RepID=A0ABR9XLI2_9SPHI|nr:zincin-like metallopeptidase domain-containing protein [Mucilaginibacter boryungensis]MBE9668223.1 hypothetical protein [Mucilaginibacter boryungensis]
MPNCPPIRHGKLQAYYDTQKDYIGLPRQKLFSIAESYYATLFHELIHATGHESRLAQKKIMDFGKYGSEQYCVEELTAEIGAAI